MSFIYFDVEAPVEDDEGLMVMVVVVDDDEDEDEEDADVDEDGVARQSDDETVAVETGTPGALNSNSAVGGLSFSSEISCSSISSFSSGGQISYALDKVSLAEFDLSK